MRRTTTFLACCAVALAGCADQDEPTGVPPGPSFDHEAGHSCVVTSTGDNGAGTLREKVADPDCPIITFNLGAGAHTITLTTGEIAIGRDVTIDGPGADLLTISGNNASRVFHIESFPADPTIPELPLRVIIAGMTITGGSGGFAGGGVLNDGGNVLLERCAVVANTASLGGGIHSSGPLTVMDCTISGNTADDFGGGIFSWEQVANRRAPVEAVNSTISGNSAVTGGGGILLAFSEALTLRHVTVTDNAVISETGVDPMGGVCAAIIRLEHTIVHGNTADVDPDVCAVVFEFGEAESSVTGSWNLVGADALLVFDGGANNISGDPLLGALADNGGPTMTHALGAGSPAIDAGNPAFSDPAIPDDQRGPGFPRIANGRIDIGAFEFQMLNVIPVDIDIKPDRNDLQNLNPAPIKLNPNGNGLIPVAVLGGPTINVHQIDVLTLRFGPGMAEPAHDLTDGDTRALHTSDVNADGFSDLISHYQTSQTGIMLGDTEACLEFMIGAQVYRGCDAIVVQ